MPGSFDLDNSRPSLTSNALSVGVFRYAPPSSYTLLPNLRCDQIEYSEGPNPPTCRLSYVMDDSLSLNLGWPSNFEDLWPIDARGRYVLNPDDRMAVIATNPNGSPWVLFDGFAQIPQADVTPGSQRVNLTAVGVAVRCFDDTISGRLQRDSDAAGLKLTDGKADRQTDLPTRFNPADTSISDGNKGGYIPNRTAADTETQTTSDGTEIEFHVFLDQDIERFPDPRAYWTVADAVDYLLVQYNKEQTYVKLTSLRSSDDLEAHFPSDGHDTMDPNDSSTFESDPVQLRDFECTNKPWPEAISELIGYCGFVMRFDTNQDGSGNPRTDLKFYRRDEFSTISPKLVYLPESDPTNRPDVNPATANVIALHLARDLNSVVNAWEVETSQRKVEVSVVLAPLYEPAIADKAAAARKAFYTSGWDATTTSLIRRKYRWYGVDELGDGHWTDGQWITEAAEFDWSPVFPPDDNGRDTYVIRYRPGSHRILSMDDGHHPLVSQLAVSFDYMGSAPSIWDGTGTWQTIPGGWQLLPDRLGIELTLGDLSEWDTGKAAGTGKVTRINAINYWADPPTGSPTNGKAPFLRLTTVIEDDLTLPISVPKRVASPTKFTRRRTADARDHFQFNSVQKDSVYWSADGGTGEDPWVIRDDTKAANTHAYQLRSSTEFPPTAGSVTFPFLTGYYEVGDRIRVIQGRNATLQANAGGEQGQAPIYPWVVGVQWQMEGGRQTTTLQLSDARATQKQNL